MASEMHPPPSHAHPHPHHHPSIAPPLPHHHSTGGVGGVQGAHQNMYSNGGYAPPPPLSLVHPPMLATHPFARAPMAPSPLVYTHHPAAWNFAAYALQQR